jgi:hypothetical protein
MYIKMQWLCCRSQKSQTNSCNFHIKPYSTHSGCLQCSTWLWWSSRVQLRLDGTGAETRFRLSAKRTSPRDSARGQFCRLLAAEVYMSAGSICTVLETPRSCEACWIPTPFSCCPFISPPTRRRVPCHLNRTLRTGNRRCYSFWHHFPDRLWANPSCCALGNGGVSLEKTG